MKMSAGRISAPVRSPAPTPRRVLVVAVRGSPGTAATARTAAAPPIAKTGAYPMVPASTTPSGSATIAGTPATTPVSASPSPRRSGGMSDAVNAPPATTVIPKPSPRTRHTATISAGPADTIRPKAGAPRSNRPVARTVRYPNLAATHGVVSSPATLVSIRALVAHPATAPDPVEAAASGTTESSR